MKKIFSLVFIGLMAIFLVAYLLSFVFSYRVGFPVQGISLKNTCLGVRQDIRAYFSNEAGVLFDDWYQNCYGIVLVKDNDSGIPN